MIGSAVAVLVPFGGLSRNRIAPFFCFSAFSASSFAFFAASCFWGGGERGNHWRVTTGGGNKKKSHQSIIS